MADLFYHLLVLLLPQELRSADVEAELARRFGVSGLEEKASRKKANADSADAAKPVEEIRQEESRQSDRHTRQKESPPQNASVTLL